MQQVNVHTERQSNWLAIDAQTHTPADKQTNCDDTVHWYECVCVRECVCVCVCA